MSIRPVTGVCAVALVVMASAGMSAAPAAASPSPAPERPFLAAPGDPACSTAPQSWVAGSVDLCRGTLVYSDYVHDDYGADTGAMNTTSRTSSLAPTGGDQTYPTPGNDATADLVRLTMHIDGNQLVVVALLNALFEPTQTTLGIAIDRDNNILTGGGKWSTLNVISTGWDEVHLFNQGDIGTNTITGRIPLPTGTEWRVQAVTAISSNGQVMNVAFRGTDERARSKGSGTDSTMSAWFDEKQSAALRLGIISEFGTVVRPADMVAGVTKLQPPTGPGFYERVYRSDYTVGPRHEGVDVAGVPGRGDGGGGAKIGFEQGFQYLGHYQPYGIYIPPGGGPYGMQMVWHGANANFTSLINQPGMQARFGNELHRILVTSEGRGKLGFASDAAERDHLDVMADVQRTYQIDPNRVFAGGYSMGGYVAYRMSELYPDRFAGMVNWVGFTGDSANGTPTSTYTAGAVGNTIDFVRNLRWIPSALLYASADELVHANTAVAMQQAFAAADDVYTFYLHQAEHLSFAILDDWRKEAAYTKNLVRTEDPNRVTYRTATFLGSPAYGIIQDRAYWVSQIRGRSADVKAYQDVDLLRGACGGTVPVLAPTNPGAGVDPLPWNSVGEGVNGSTPVAPSPALSGTLTNVASLRVDATRTCISGVPFTYDITTDGPTTVTFSDGRVLSLPAAGRHQGTLGKPVGGYFPVGPERVFDTRGESPNALRQVPIAQVGNGNVLEVKMTDLPGGVVPASGVGAVSLNVAVTNPRGPGFVTVFPCGTRKLTASVNYVAGETVSNAVITPVSATGSVCFFSYAPADIVVDVNGWFAAGGAFTTLAPERIFDTRGESPNALRQVPVAQVAEPNVLEVKVVDLASVPATGVGAVSLNVAVTNPKANGFVTVFPCGQRTLVASVNYVAGQTVSNAVLAPVSPTGTVCFASYAPADIVVDVNGWFAPGAMYQAVGPQRVFDTRGESPNAMRTVPVAKVGATPLEVKLTDLDIGVPPTGVGAVSLNVAVTNPDGPGFITVYPCGTRKLVASVNYAAGETVSNAVIAPVSSNGTVCFYAYAPADIVVDINGWFIANS